MCNPAAITAISAVGAIGSSNAAKREGEAQQSYYQYLAAQNQQQADQVAKTENLNAGIVSDLAAREETNLDRTTSALTGTQRATEAANGVFSGSKTAEQIATDTSNKANLDRAAIRTNASLQTQSIAMRSTNEQSSLRSQAASFLTAGNNARITGDINAANSLLNGATNVANRWYQYTQQKPEPRQIQSPYEGAV